MKSLQASLLVAGAWIGVVTYQLFAPFAIGDEPTYNAPSPS